MPYSKGWRQDKIDALMSNIIVQISRNDAFRKEMNERLGKAVDTSEFESQAENINKQIRNKTITLKRKMAAIDNFDWDVDNADTLYDALNADYIRLQGDVLTLEKSLEDVNNALERIKSQEVTKDSALAFISRLGTEYGKLSEVKKKEVASKIIEKVEIFPEEQEDGSIIKSVTFRFPITIGGKTATEWSAVGQTTDTNVETVVSLINRNSQAKHHVNVDLDTEEYHRIKDSKK